MVGGTEQGENWISGAPFIDSVTMMSSYWLWRAVGGSLMLLSHILFAFNVWRMRPAAAADMRTETAGEPS